MTPRRLSAALAVVGVLVVPIASAEVRLVARGASGTLGFEVQPTSRGPWTPVGTVDALVLNPAGDLRGDGMPAHAADGDVVAAAWVAPSDDALVVARGTVDGWRPLASIAAPEATGLPTVRQLADGWAVAWQEASGECVVRLARVDADGLVPFVPLAASGVLVAMTSVADVAHLATLSPTGELALWTADLAPVAWGGPTPAWTWSGVLAILPTPEPIIEFCLATSEPRTGVLGSLPPLRKPTVAGRSGMARTAWPDVQAHAGLRFDGSTFAVLAWRTVAGDVAFVELTPSGPMLPVETLACRGERPTACVLAAVDAVRRR